MGDLLSERDFPQACWIVYDEQKVLLFMFHGEWGSIKDNILIWV